MVWLGPGLCRRNRPTRSQPCFGDSETGLRRPYLLEGGDPAFWRELVSLLSRGLWVGLEARPPDRGSWSAVCTRENQRRFPGQSHWGLSGNMKGDRKRQRSLLSANVPIPVFLRTPPPPASVQWRGLSGRIVWPSWLRLDTYCCAICCLQSSQPWFRQESTPRSWAPESPLGSDGTASGGMFHLQALENPPLQSS